MTDDAEEEASASCFSEDAVVDAAVLETVGLAAEEDSTSSSSSS